MFSAWPFPASHDGHEVCGGVLAVCLFLSVCSVLVCIGSALGRLKAFGPKGLEDVLRRASVCMDTEVRERGGRVSTLCIASMPCLYGADLQSTFEALS